MVLRLDSCAGDVALKYRTERLSAVPGYDFTETEGEMEFEDGETEKFIELEILAKGMTRTKDEFMLVLEELEGPAEFSPNNDGGLESEILTIEIGPRGTIPNTLSGKLVTWLDQQLNFDDIRLGTADWSEQFVNAMYCNGSPEEQAEASAFDWVFHILALPW